MKLEQKPRSSRHSAIRRQIAVAFVRMREHPSQRVLRVSRKIMLIDFGRPNWTQNFAERLPLQWPTLDRSDLDHLAGALLAEVRWKSMEPARCRRSVASAGHPERTASREQRPLTAVFEGALNSFLDDGLPDDIPRPPGGRERQGCGLAWSGAQQNRQAPFLKRPSTMLSVVFNWSTKSAQNCNISRRWVAYSARL